MIFAKKEMLHTISAEGKSTSPEIITKMRTHLPLVKSTFDEFMNTTFANLIAEKPVKDFIEYQYATLIRQYASIVICIIGVIGNCLSMIVLFQKHNRKISCYLYFGFIAISDNVLLINAGAYQCLVDFSPEKITDGVCRAANGLWFASLFSSTYILTHKNRKLERKHFIV